MHKLSSYKSRLIVLTVLIVSIIGYLIISAYNNEKDRVLREHVLSGEHLIKTGEKIILRTLKWRSKDIDFLKNNLKIHSFLESPYGNDITAPSLPEEWSLYTESRVVYDQMRWIGTDGMEKIRIQMHDNKALVIPPEKLQNKVNRYYVQESLSLEQNRIYLSPLDLNVENGQIETPFKPTIRIGVRITDSSNRIQGVLIANYRAEDLLQRLKEIDPEHTYLTNANGYWLLSPDANDQWGFMLDKPDLTLAKRYPDAWKKMMTSKSGTFVNKDGVWVYSTLFPDENATNRFADYKTGQLSYTQGHYPWRLIYFAPYKEVSAVLSPIKQYFLLFSATVFLLIMLLFWRLWHYHQIEQDALHAAEKANRMKTEFIASMSHEVRNPMNAIIGMSYLALQTKLTDKQGNYINKIHTSATNLLSILNEILDYSKLDAGKMDLENIPFNLVDIIDNTLNVTKLKAYEKQIDLSIRLEKDVPRQLNGDPVRLGQVLINLVSNAIKFTPKDGKITLRVSRESETSDDTVSLHFAVKDSGIGLTEKQQKKLFRVFTQAEKSDSRQFGGTGLGLAISKKIVTVMNGRIWVESQKDQGSTFHFIVQLKPLCPDDELVSPMRETGANSDEEDSALTTLQGKRALLVEDEEINRELISELLDQFGMLHVATPNGLQALKLLEKQAVDIVLMDCLMPVMDGYETTRKIREQETLKHLPIIGLSANIFHEDRQKALQAGMNAYLTKPINPRELLLCMADQLHT